MGLQLLLIGIEGKVTEALQDRWIKWNEIKPRGAGAFVLKLAVIDSAAKAQDECYIDPGDRSG
ncbi:hypothetical protein ACFVVQ_18265 [Paenibacillus chitinolyticus]|uniref:hypothetical protein n=1 Tax=Paenibacillus chitinolyticus TaxID=79263 RepID=UPI0036D7A1D1